MTTFATDKSYANVVNTAPHPAAYCQTIAAADATFRRPSRWLMISDATAKAVQLILAGAVRATPAVIAGVSGDLTMAASGVLTSTTSGKFNSLSANDIIVVKGFSNSQNNGTFKILTKTSATNLTLAVAGATVALAGTVAETPAGTAVSIQGPDTETPDGVTLTMNPGVMYPICAAKMVGAGTTAANLLVFY